MLTVLLVWDLRSTQEAIPRLCVLLLKDKRWFLQMLEPSLAILARGPTVAMFTSTMLWDVFVMSLCRFFFWGFKGGRHSAYKAQYRHLWGAGNILFLFFSDKITYNYSDAHIC